MPPSRVYLYDEPAATRLHLGELSLYVKEIAPLLEIDLRDSFLHHHLSALAEGEREEAVLRVARGFAQAKVRHPLRREQEFTPLHGEVEYERRRLTDRQSKSFGILYDGFKLMNLLLSLLPGEERGLSHIHIVFTNQLFGTWDESDQRYHARVNVCGSPSLISTSGIVEAPAKPREYYLIKQQYAALGMTDASAVLEDHFRGRFIGYDDERLTDVLKGYVMQAIAGRLWGEPFCDDPNCRLYNAHWQEEVIRAQLNGDYEFCPYHQQRFKELA